MVYIGSLKGEKSSTNGYFRLHIYLRTNKTLIYNSLYVLENWREKFKPQKLQYNYSKKINDLQTCWVQPRRIFQKPLHCTVLDLITGNFEASQFWRILDKFTRRAKPIRIIDGPDNQLPDNWNSTVFHYYIFSVLLIILVFLSWKYLDVTANKSELP